MFLKHLNQFNPSAVDPEKNKELFALLEADPFELANGNHPVDMEHLMASPVTPGIFANAESLIVGDFTCFDLSLVLEDDDEDEDEDDDDFWDDDDDDDDDFWEDDDDDDEEFDEDDDFF